MRPKQTISITKLGDGRYRAAYYDLEGKRKFLTSKDSCKLKQMILTKAEELQAGEQKVSNEEWQEFQKWKNAAKPISLREAFDRFSYAQSLKQNRSARGLTEKRQLIWKMIVYVDPRGERALRDIQTTELEAWIHEHENHAPLTKRHRRTGICQFFNWCRDQEFLPYAKHAAERTGSIQVLPNKKEILSPAQMRVIIDNAKPQFIPFIMFSAFAGIRHGELRPRNGERKDPLRWSDIGIDTQTIKIRPETSKNGRARIIPIQPNLLAWLSDPKTREKLSSSSKIVHIQGSAMGPETSPPICQSRKDPAKLHKLFSDEESARLGRVLGLPAWPTNCLRHSYCTYRMAVLRDPGRVSEEMGNGIADVRNHYDAVITEDFGREWWQIGLEDEKKIQIL